MSFVTFLHPEGGAMFIALNHPHHPHPEGGATIRGGLFVKFFYDAAEIAEGGFYVFYNI
jgi:hypothetical protein